jgi:ABC-2 type transport system ATP-binding protein
MNQTTAIRMDNLSKTFGKNKKQIKAVRNISLEIAAGQVYGFLGPNGAGKTTTIRLLLDLVRPTEGKAYLYGQDVRQDYQVLRRVGSMVEGAQFYPYLTGRRNLEVLARTADNYDAKRIDALLEQVGLTDRANQRFAKYSMGMKQRLGLASSLLNDPELLIFDEPTNGLDPAGIKEMRSFIRDLVYEHGKTVFLSSHLLNEVEQICDRVAIIDEGEIIQEGTVADLLAQNPSIKIVVTPTEKAIEALQTAYQVKESEEENTLLIETEHTETPQIVRKLVGAGIDIYEIGKEQQSLEDFFLRVTEEHHGNGRLDNV